MDMERAGASVIDPPITQEHPRVAAGDGSGDAKDWRLWTGEVEDQTDEVQAAQPPKPEVLVGGRGFDVTDVGRPAVRNALGGALGRNPEVTTHQRMPGYPRVRVLGRNALSSSFSRPPRVY